MLKTKETDIVNACLDLLEYKRLFAFRINTMGNYNPKTNSYYKNPRLKRGCPDIILILPTGQFVGIEVKSEKGKQSEYQIDFQKQIEKSNAQYWLIHSVEELLIKL